MGIDIGGWDEGVVVPDALGLGVHPGEEAHGETAGRKTNHYQLV